MSERLVTRKRHRKHRLRDSSALRRRLKRLIAAYSKHFDSDSESSSFSVPSSSKDDSGSEDDQQLSSYAIGSRQKKKQLQPRSSDGRRLVTRIEVDVAVLDQSWRNLRQRTALSLRPTAPTGKAVEMEALHVLSAVARSAQVTEGSVEVKADNTAASGSEYCFRWVHLKEDCPSLDAFKRKIMEIEELTEADALVASQVLNRAREVLERDFVNGKYMKAGVVRCDGYSEYDRDTPDASALFMSIPYFKMHVSTRGATTRGSFRHPMRSLLQSAYDSHSTADRAGEHFMHDHSQLVPQSIHVPSVWALVLNNGRFEQLAEHDLRH